uniref:CHCH domain-containing protein n=1 Tax=Parastrongyloides trichosuri TaxID=131310 RepID=A0A0N4ZZ38_PARTI
MDVEKSKPEMFRVSDKDVVYQISKAEFYSDIEDPYARKLSLMPTDELFSKYNPGPTKPDGSPNFECHCVGHLVASPCGYAFRDLLICQKKESKTEFEEGACSSHFVDFMNCVMKTGCFGTSSSSS